MMRTVATLAALVGGANAQGYTCSANFDPTICATVASPGAVPNSNQPCGCSNGFECTGTPTDNTLSCDVEGPAACGGIDGCAWTAVSSSRDCGIGDAETCCLPKTCQSTGWDYGACTGRWEAGEATSPCPWDGCTVTDCCIPAVGQPVDCEGTWDDCDSTTCKEAADRVFTPTVNPEHGGRPCPTSADAISCFDEPATDTYDGSCKDTCDATLCTGDTELAAWATAGACTGTPTDSTQSCDVAEAACGGVDGCEWMSQPDCDGACTAADCCVPNECTVPDWTTASDPGCKDSRCRELTLGASGYYAENPGATTVDGLGMLGCSTGVKVVTAIAKSDDATQFGSTGGFLGRPYDVVATCPSDGGNFVWTGCTEAADCDGAAEREAAPATCIAKGHPPSCDQDDPNQPIVCELGEGESCIATCSGVMAGVCTAIGDVLSTGCTYNPHDTEATGRQLATDKAACEAITGPDLADATKCEAVVTAGRDTEWEQGTCTLADGTTGPCRTYTDATCTLPVDAQPTDDVCQDPPAPCQFTGTGRGPGDCPDGCVYEPASGAACIYTPEVKSDKIDMQNLGDHVVDTTGDTSCAAKDPQGKLTHFESCKVTCEDGWHLEESKRDQHKNRISNPKYWRPLHPVCDDGILHYSVKCVEDTDWLGVLIIVAVLGFFLVLIPVVKYMRVVASYNQDKAAGCTWAPDGTKSDPTAASDEAAD